MPSEQRVMFERFLLRDCVSLIPVTELRLSINVDALNTRRLPRRRWPPPRFSKTATTTHADGPLAFGYLVFVHYRRPYLGGVSHHMRW